MTQKGLETEVELWIEYWFQVNYISTEGFLIEDRSNSGGFIEWKKKRKEKEDDREVDDLQGDC